MKREDVEALVEFCESGHPAMADAPIRLTRREAAALGRRWLAVEDAPVGRLDIGRNDCDDADMVEIVIDPNHASHLQYQRVRIVPEQGEAGREP